MFKGTVKELAQKMGVDYQVAHGFVKLLVSRNMAELVEKRKQPSGRGKPSNVYEIPEKLEITL